MKHVEEYMFRDLTSVNENSIIRRVINTMRLHRLCVVPVINNLGEYIGCINELSILDVAIPMYMKSIYNTSFMADIDQITSNLHSILNEKAIKLVDKNYPWVSPTDSMSYAADLLYRHKVNMLPVLEGKMVVGMISQIEILSVSLDK
ncbi:MAG: CBS domain-containing protein [Bacteroidales bacterium]|nr:CBS domain-containing protein [Bacteroidales bacterium]MBN2819561.1 CBS domain-containing protein [Bacteroidales bacterium]